MIVRGSSSSGPRGVGGTNVVPAGGFAPGSSGDTSIVDPGGGTNVWDLNSDGGIGAFGLPVSGDTPRSSSWLSGTRGSGIAGFAEDGIGFAGVASDVGVVVAVGTGAGAGTCTAAGAGAGFAASFVASTGESGFGIGGASTTSGAVGAGAGATTAGVAGFS